MIKLPQHIFFDLGNVIIPIDFSRNWDCFVRFGGDRKHLEENWGLQYSLHPMMKEYESGALTTDGLRAKFQEFFLAGRELTLAEFEEGLASLLLPIPPHRIALVDRLRYQGYHCHVISNNTDLHTKHIRKAFIKDFGRSLEDSFERVFLSQEVHCRKPDKKIYELALREVGAKPEDSLMIDDLAANLVSPKTLGMHTLLVSPEEEVEDRMKATFIY